MSTQFYRPIEVADLLGVSTATLRRWARQYQAWLSTDAGGTQPGTNAGGRHRRYARSDVQALAQVKALIQSGLTHDEVQQRLGQRDGSLEESPELIEMAVTDMPVREILPLHTEDAATLQRMELAQWMTQTLDTVSDSQQMLLSGQHTARQLLGVLLQDNFNLKDENTRLRERMLEAERKLYELKRELDGSREQEKERLRQLESYLFELQRRLDSVTQQVVVRQAPAAPVVAPEPVSLPPADVVSPAPPEPAPAPKRGFWVRLFRRHLKD